MKTKSYSQGIIIINFARETVFTPRFVGWYFVGESEHKRPELCIKGARGIFEKNNVVFSLLFSHIIHQTLETASLRKVLPIKINMFGSVLLSNFLSEITD